MTIARGFKNHLDTFADVMTRASFTDSAGNGCDAQTGMDMADAMLREAKSARVFVIGNGGSAAVASHMVNDLVNMCKIFAVPLTDQAVITCMANDYGYENAYARLIATMAGRGDVLIAISSSGNSMNIRNAVTAMSEAGGSSFTLSGFSADNPLRKMGKLNLWLDSTEYGIVEIGHSFALHHLAERLAKQD